MDNIIAIVVARMGSTRLPGKALKPLAGSPLLQRIIERVIDSKCIGRIVIATTTKSIDDELVDLAKKLNIDFFRGSEDDVLGRLVGVINKYTPDVVVCLTGDNPLIDPKLVDDMINFFYEGNYDYVSSTHMYHSSLWGAERTFPVGVSVQVVKASVLIEADKEISDMSVRGHGTFGIYNRSDYKYKLGAFQAEGIYHEWKHPELRFTIDTNTDYEIMQRIFEELCSHNPKFSTIDAIKLVLKKNLYSPLL